MAYKQRTGVAAATQSVLTDDTDFLRVLTERMVQAVLEAEMTAHLHADPYARSADRRGYRDGYKPRQLNTRVGTLTLQVPLDRGRSGRLSRLSRVPLSTPSPDPHDERVGAAQRRD